MFSNNLPLRHVVYDETGQKRTLYSGLDAFECLWRGTGKKILFLGLGTEAATLTTLIKEEYAKNRLSVSEKLFCTWIEAPEMLKQHLHVFEEWQQDSSNICQFVQQTEKKSPFDLKQYSAIWLYKAGEQFFPSFWSSLLGHVRVQILYDGNMPTTHFRDNRVILPGTTGDLLTLELEAAFAASGYVPVRIEPQDPDALMTVLREGRPALYCTINLRGLDKYGKIANILQACDVPVAVWFVDNPWHVLSRIRLPWWRSLYLFVTDCSFVEPLRQHGAKHAHFLPLAAWYTATETRNAFEQKKHTNDIETLFVGRSAFPDKAHFFAGCTVPDILLEYAEMLLSLEGQGKELPHAQWWEKKLGLTRLWPETQIRKVGFGAEICAQKRRTAWLIAAANHNLTVYGDQNWQTLLPTQVTIRNPVDYYTTLPTLYASATVTLNVTSLLLPKALTQRHFDVWMSGGFLLSDATAGLDIFPRYLTELMNVSNPTTLQARLSHVHRDTALRHELSFAWQQHLLSHHTYQHRVQEILNHIQ